MPNPTSKLNLVINGATTQLDIHDSNAVDLTNNQTVGGDKEFTGTTTAHDVIPSATDTYNFGSSSYQWNNAYIKSLTINGVACGDILTHNASEFVGVSGNQTISGVKTFSSNITIQGSYNGNEFSSNARTVLEFRANRDTANKSGIYLSKFRQNRAQGEMGYNDSHMLAIDVLENEVRTNDLFRFSFKGWVNDVPTMAYLEPYNSNTQTFLGTASHKWADVGTNAINGINPGALSLPNTASPIQLDTTSFDVTATTIGTFASTVDGWAILSMSQKNKPFGIWIISEFYRASFYSVKNNTDYMIFALIPVKANLNMTIYCTADDIDSTRVINWLRVYPCQGNV